MSTLSEWIIKPSSEVVNNSSTFQDDDDLQVTLEGGAKYWFDMEWFFSTDATANFKAQLAYTGTMTAIRWYANWTPGGVSTAVRETVYTSLGQIMTSIGSGANGYYQLRGYLEPSNGGIFKLTWAQSTATAVDTTLWGGARLRVQKYQ
jgi:hypothetical protein